MALVQSLATTDLPEIGVILEKFLHDLAVFLCQHAASCVDQASARLEQCRRRREDGLLFCREFVDGTRRLPPFQIRIATQCAEPAAWRVYQHAINSAGQALYLDVVFTRDELRVYV